MIKERYNVFQSLRLFFLGIFVSDTSSGIIFLLSFYAGCASSISLQIPHANFLAKLTFFSETLIILSPLNQQPLFLWAKSPTDIGKTHRISSIKFQKDTSKLLPRINQYPINNPFKTVKEDDKAQGHIFLCISP